MEAGRRAAAAAERARERRFRLALLGLGVGMGAVAGGLVLMEEGAGAQQAWGLVVMPLALIASAGAGVLAWRWRPAAPGEPRADGLSRRDREQRARRSGLWATPWVLGLGLVVVTPAAWRLVQGSEALADWLWAGCGLLYAWIAPAMVMGWDGRSRKLRKFLEDEFTTALRARAMTAGFVALLAAMSGVYVLGLWRPEAAVAAMPVALAAGGLAAALRFALLDRAADAGDDG